MCTTTRDNRNENCEVVRIIEIKLLPRLYTTVIRSTLPF